MIPQKVKGQQSIFVVKQAIMVEVQQLNLCTIEIYPCYLPRHKNLLLTFDLLGLSKTIIPFFHWALQLYLPLHPTHHQAAESRSMWGGACDCFVSASGSHRSLVEVEGEKTPGYGGHRLLCTCWKTERMKNKLAIHWECG